MLFKRPSKYWKQSRENKKIQNRDPFYDKINGPNFYFNDISLEKIYLINEIDHELSDYNSLKKDIIDISTIRIDEKNLGIKDQKQLVFPQNEVSNPSIKETEKEQPWWEKKKGTCSCRNHF